MKRQDNNDHQDDEKTIRRERFKRRKLGNRIEEESSRKPREHYKRDNTRYDHLLDEEWDELDYD